MKVVITGGGGFLGRRLARQLRSRSQLVGANGKPETIDEIVLFDVAPPPAEDLADNRVRAVTGDAADRKLVAEVIDAKTASVFHLAAVVSAGAEADFDLGYRSNLEGTLAVLEAARASGKRPRVVFASTLAVYGGEMPPEVNERVALTPQTSYGTQKAIGELLINDYTRKGFVDGRALRLPTIVVRPGKPNKAASTFASSIVREPLSGVDTVCPVTPETVMPILSPRKVIEAFVRMHELDGTSLGPARTLQLPGIAAKVGKLVSEMQRLGKGRKLGKVNWQPDPQIQQIVDGWPLGIGDTRGEKLGFQVDKDVAAVIEAFIEDDLPAQIASLGR
jgi:nucleoside-diphosphate-sugar epimerase